MEGWWAASYVVLWILVVVLCLVVVALARQIGTLFLRVESRGALEIDDEGPPLEEATGPTETVDVMGHPVVLGGPGEAQLLLFVSPGCQLCRAVLPSVGAVARAGRLVPYVVTDADREETLAAFGKDSLGAPVVPGPEIARAFGVPGTPYVVVLDPSGTAVAKGTVNNLEQMEGLVDTATRRLDDDPIARVNGSSFHA
ncbi:MAG: thiol-disulfide isomerase [Actinomycetota bacterium]|nr:thiol-disulfide isomerase [Actinomycetota bacterium]